MPRMSDRHALLLAAACVALPALAGCEGADAPVEDDDDVAMFEAGEGADSDVGVANVGGGECDGFDRGEAEPVHHLLSALGYTEFDAGEHDSQSVEVVTDADHWAEVVERFGTDGGVRPDFSLDAVFVHPWAFDGCTRGPFYDGYRWGDAVRLEIRFGEAQGCDLYLPMLDFIVLPAEGVESFGTCG